MGPEGLEDFISFFGSSLQTAYFSGVLLSAGHMHFSISLGESLVIQLVGILLAEVQLSVESLQPAQFTGVHCCFLQSMPSVAQCMDGEQHLTWSLSAHSVIMHLVVSRYPCLISSIILSPSAGQQSFAIIIFSHIAVQVYSMLAGSYCPSEMVLGVVDSIMVALKW